MLLLPTAARAQQNVDDAKTTPQSPGLPTRSQVYYAHDPGAIEHYVVNAERVHGMVDRLLLAVTGKENVSAAWNSLVSPKDIVGIKISTTGAAPGATHRAIVTTLVEGLLAAGVPRSHILVWDREADDLRAAGYLARRDQPGSEAFICPVEGIEPRWGYDPKAVYTSPVLGKLIWGDLEFKGERLPADELLRPPPPDPSPTPRVNPKIAAAASRLGILNPAMHLVPSTKQENLSNVSHYCTILSRKVTKIINVPVLSDNIFTGIGGALYNVTIPNVDNWRRLVGPPQYGVTAIPEMFSDPRVGGKVVLNISDGLIAQTRRRPGFPAVLRAASRDDLRQQGRGRPRRRDAALPGNLARAGAASRPSRTPPRTSRRRRTWASAISTPRKSTCTNCKPRPFTPLSQQSLCARPNQPLPSRGRNRIRIHEYRRRKRPPRTRPL